MAIATDYLKIHSKVAYTPQHFSWHPSDTNDMYSDARLMKTDP
jgi:hypothetical protein